jgi:transposase
VRFAHPAQQIVQQDYIHAVADAEARLARLTRQIEEELLPSWSMAPVVTAVQAMRGVALVVAVTVVAEIGDFQRFANARQLMAAYLGLVPSEHSSGSSVRRGGITKAGNVLARRVLIEGAWTYRMPARVSRKLHDRTRNCRRSSATSPGRPSCGSARAIAGSLPPGRRRLWSPRQLPARWSASSGQLPASLSRNSRDEQSLNAIRDRTHQRCAPPATGPTVGNPRRLL